MTIKTVDRDQCIYIKLPVTKPELCEMLKTTIYSIFNCYIAHRKSSGSVKLLTILWDLHMYYTSLSMHISLNKATLNRSSVPAIQYQM